MSFSNKSVHISNCFCSGNSESHAVAGDRSVRSGPSTGGSSEQDFMTCSLLFLIDLVPALTVRQTNLPEKLRILKF